MKILVLGCGYRKFVPNKDEVIINLDVNPNCKPDILHDLTKHPLPFKDEEFNEIYAREVLEHLAQQGDYRFFFKEFSEYWRILKPKGKFIGEVPAYNSPWAFGDPSHKRIISKGTLMFLDQSNYEQIGKTTMSDFRNIYKADFRGIDFETIGTTFRFILEKR